MILAQTETLLIDEALLLKCPEASASKGKSKKRRTTRAITPELKDEEEEGINEDIYKSESDYIIVASSRIRSK